MSSGQTSSLFMQAEDNAKINILFKVHLYAESQEVILNAHKTQWSDADWTKAQQTDVTFDFHEGP